MYLPLRPRLKFNYREASSGEICQSSQHTDDTAITNFGGDHKRGNDSVLSVIVSKYCHGKEVISRITRLVLRRIQELEVRSFKLFSLMILVLNRYIYSTKKILASS